MDLKQLAKTGLEYSCEKKYEKLFESKQLSYADWILSKESELEHFDLSVFDEKEEIMTENNLPHWNSEYTCRYDNLSFRIVSMDVCCFGYNVRQYLDDIVVFVNGRLSEIAIPLMAAFFEKHPKAIAVYGDEDILADSGVRINPYFKPDFSPDELLSHFYFCNLVAVRRSAFREMDWTGDMTKAASLYHNLLRLIYSDRKYIDYGVGHIEAVLVHGQDYSNDDLTDATFEKLSSRLKISDFSKLKDEERRISIIICTKDHPDMLKKCLETLVSFATNFSLELIVVDNGSQDANRERNERLIDRYSFKYIFEPAEFNFSAMCNRGAKEATSPLLFFLNDDVEICDVKMFENIWRLCSFDYVGAAGVKLLYPEDNKIQHAGIVNSPYGPVHKLQGLVDSKSYYHGFNRFNTNRIAVTGAALAIRKALFDELLGFDENFPVAYNDVDLCYRLLEKGYYISCCNLSYAIHKESVTRGSDISDKKAARLKEDYKRLCSLHPAIGKNDPFYNSHLLRETLDVRIVPGNEYCMDEVMETAKKAEPIDLSDCREDKCLIVSVEFAGAFAEISKNERDAYLVQGYGVLTGSNNACYAKTLLLQGCGNTYAVNVEGCTRSDLFDAMPGEKNIGLAGFSIEISKDLLPKGEYRLGMLFKRDFSKEKIYNYTGKYLSIE